MYENKNVYNCIFMENTVVSELESLFPVCADGKCSFFALGRNAMYAVCRALKLNPGDEVLTPAFDCDGSLQPFKVLGLKLNFFRSKAHNFSVDIDDIKKRITPKTKLLHIINHFGFPQPWDELLSLRKNISIPILEDNAYSLFSAHGGRLLGTFGDFSFFSLRKNLPLPDGGLLRVNNPRYSITHTDKKASFFYYSDIPALLKSARDNMGCYKIRGISRKLLKPIMPSISMPPPLYSKADRGCPDWPLRDVLGKEFTRDFLRPMSGISRVMIRRFLGNNSVKDIIDKKRYYYGLLSRRLAALKNIEILWPELPEGIVPFCLSFLVKTDKRDILLERLQDKYYVMAWPMLSKEILNRIDEFPEVELLGRKLFQIILPSEKVILPSFDTYIENLIRDLTKLLN